MQGRVYGLLFLDHLLLLMTSLLRIRFIWLAAAEEAPKLLQHVTFVRQLQHSSVGETQRLRLCIVVVRAVGG